MTALDETRLLDTGGRAVAQNLADGSRVLGTLRTGIGFAGRHHGEILQGAWRAPNAASNAAAAPQEPVRGATGIVRPVRGRNCCAPGTAGPVPCLVTMPVPEHGSTARFDRGADSSIQVRPAWKVKAARAARLALDLLGEQRTGGMLTVDCPVPAGLGLGSSTSDVVAAIRAVCNAYCVPMDSRRVARLAVAAEGASDPIMFEEGVLFAPRRGRVLQRWAGGLPAFLVVSIDTDPGRGGVDTLSIPVPQYTAAELDQYEELILRARMAFREHDAVALAAVATRSAELNQRFLPMRGFAQLLALTRRPGCLGLQISHSGTVAGLLFDPASGQEAACGVQPAVEALGMRCLGVFRAGRGSEAAGV